MNSHLNNEIDLLVDQFVSNPMDSDFLICPTRINDLCLQPELVLCNKINLPLWNCSLSSDQRKFHLLFYRFIENLSNLSVEYDYFISKHPGESNLINLCKEMTNPENNLLLRISIELDSLRKKLTKSSKTKFVDEQLFFENIDGQFWFLMKEYFLQALSS